MGSLVPGRDHLVFLHALSIVLGQHGYQRGAVVGSAAGLAESARRQPPDACVISHNATSRKCSDLTQCVATARHGSRILLVRADADQRAVLRALEAGAVGYRPRPPQPTAPRCGPPLSARGRVDRAAESPCRPSMGLRKRRKAFAVTGSR